MATTQYNTLTSASTGRVVTLFAGSKFIIQGIERSMFIVNDATTITDIDGKVISFLDLKLNTIVIVTPSLANLSIAVSVSAIPTALIR